MKRCKVAVVTAGILFLYISFVCAQTSLKEGIKEKIKKRFQEKSQKSYGADDPEFSLMHDGITRKYKVHLPSSYNNVKSFPVVIYIHGGSGDMRAAYMDELDHAADKFSFILAVPEGTGEVKFGHLRGVWNGGKWAIGECCGSADDVGFISKMIDELKIKFKVDEKRIYATGISNGGLMTNRIGCELSDKIAAIATVAPAAIESECYPLRPMPVMNIHGTLDPANPPDGSPPRSIFAKDSGTGFSMPYKRMTPYQVVEEWKKINKCSDGQINGYQKGGAKCVIYNDCAGGSEVEFCLVEGMGHAYPSGSQYLPEKVVGPVSYDISFDQIWEFFKKHTLSSSLDSDVRHLRQYSPGDYDFSLEHGGLTRTYKVHVPPSYDAKTPLAVILAFHGGGGKPELTDKQYGGMNRKADQEGFIVVYPKGHKCVGVRGNTFCWNAGSLFTLDFINTQVDDVGFISALIDKLAKDFSIDFKRIYATGTSNGAWMAYAVACSLSDKIAAIAPIAGGLVCETCNPASPVSIIHFHGTADPGWPYKGGGSCWTDSIRPPISQTLSKWRKLDQCSATSRITYQKGGVTCETYDCKNNSAITFCAIEGGGHTVPGGYSYPLEQIVPWDGDCALGQYGRGVGKVSQDISALDAMWEFFKKHPKNN